MGKKVKVTDATPTQTQTQAPAPTPATPVGFRRFYPGGNVGWQAELRKLRLLLHIRTSLALVGAKEEAISAVSEVEAAERARLVEGRVRIPSDLFPAPLPEEAAVGSESFCKALRRLAETLQNPALPETIRKAAEAEFASASAALRAAR